MNYGNKTTDVLYYYKPKISVFYPYPTSSNKSPYRVFFNSAWVHTYNSSWDNVGSGAAYSSAGILEYDRKLMFLHCWGRIKNGLSPMFGYDSYSHTFSVDFYSSITSKHVTMSRYHDQLTKNDNWLHIESILENLATPTKLETNLLVLKTQKNKLEQQLN